MNDEKLKIAVFIDFDNIQIGVRSTLSRDFDLALVLEALKERGEVVTKVAYGNWKRAGELTRTLTQNAVLMVQRDLTPRGDKNGADINLALDALEMAINHPHINAFVVVGGDSDFIALVEKLKQYNKAVFVVGGRSFTSSVLQRNCREFLAYENLIEAQGERRREPGRREIYPLTRVVPLVYRALKIISEREVQAQLGLLKSTLIQLDSTFNERDYGSSSFRQFVQKLANAQLIVLRQQGNSFVVEPLDREPMAVVEVAPAPLESETRAAEADASGGGEGSEGEELASPEETGAPLPPVVAALPYRPAPVEPLYPQEAAVELLDKVLAPLRGTNPRPLYLRNVKQMLRAENTTFDEQQYGFASLVDLLRAGQNQNLLRLQRDRRGALRVFIPGPPPVGGVPPAMRAESEGDGARRPEVPRFPEPGNRVEPERRASADEESDSQIAVLGFYDGVHGEANEEPELSITQAIVEELGGRKKRAPRKPKAEGTAAPKRRKAPAKKG